MQNLERAAVRYHHAILPRMAEVNMELADSRDQFRSRFAPRRGKSQQRSGPAIEIGSVNRCPGCPSHAPKSSSHSR